MVPRFTRHGPCSRPLSPYVVQIAGIAAKPSPHRWTTHSHQFIAAFLLFDFNVEAVTGLLPSASEFPHRRPSRAPPNRPAKVNFRLSFGRSDMAVKLVTGLGLAHEPTAALPPHLTTPRSSFHASYGSCFKFVFVRHSSISAGCSSGIIPPSKRLNLSLRSRDYFGARTPCPPSL